MSLYIIDNSMRCVKLLLFLSAPMFLSDGAFAQAALVPAVLPDPLDDVPQGSPLESFYDFSWRSFIALNWPAQIGPSGRGLPDRTRAFSDTNRPRVWMTWKSRYEIFQPKGAWPTPWASYDGQNPCGKGFSNDVLTLHSFRAFSDFNQTPPFANPLVAQNHSYVRYEVRVNKPEFDSIVGNKWYIADNLPTSATPVPFNIGSTAIKAAWRVLKEIDEPVRSRYYVVKKAQVFDASGKCTLQDVALVGFHIVTKTRERPQWIWSTFEHIDNVPGVTDEPEPPPNVPFSFNDGFGPFSEIHPAKPPAPISSNNASADLYPMQVVRKHPIHRLTMEMNIAYWNLPEIKGTVWQNYMLVLTQWPVNENGAPFPVGYFNLINTTMETYLQDAVKGHFPNCMDCHAIANANGRDFVWFVTTELAPSSDPMLRELMKVFEAAEKK